MSSEHREFRRRVVSLVVAGSLAMVMGAAFVTPLLPQVSAADAYVLISGFTFIPHEITIYVDQTIQWNNSDGVTHTVTSNTSAWTQVDISAGGTGTLTLHTEGTYGYHCSIHSPPTYPGMWGVITVLPSSSGIPEFSSLAFVSFGMLVVFLGIIVASKRLC